MSEPLDSGYRLSPQQRRLLACGAGDAAYHSQAVVTLAADLDSDALRAAVTRVVARHESLRTRYEPRAGRKLPLQVVSATLAPAWRVVTLPAGADGVDAFEALLREEARGFDLAQGPLLRLCLVSAAAGDRRLIVTLPALASDADGLRAFVGELGQALRADASDLALDAPIQYPDAAQVMNELVEAERLAERGQRPLDALGPLPGPSLGRERGPQTGRVFEPRVLERRLDAPAIRRVATALGATPAELLLTAWQALVWRLTAAPELVVAVGFDGRTHEGLGEAIGLFARYLPVTARLSAEAPFSAALEHTRQLLAEAAEWQDFFSWESVTEVGAEPRLVALGFDCSEAAATTGALTLERVHTCLEPFQVRLTCRLAGDALTLGFVHDERFVSQAEAACLAERYVTLLSDALQRPQASLATLRALPESERQVLATLNATGTPAHDGTTLLDLFHAQVARTPTATAVVCGTERLDFAELDARANRLAHALRCRGVGPDVPVGLFVQRSVGLIEALLGILKSGAAYVPLDPGTPAARLADALVDVGAQVVVTEQALLAALPTGAWQTLCLDRDGDELRRQPAQRVAANVTTQHLAYVIYTSGSTGRPKGVAVTHGGLANYVRFMLGRLAVQPGWNFGLATTIAADLGHTCLYPSLASGGCLHVLPRDAVTDAGAFARLCAAQPLDVLKILPSHFAALLAGGDAAVLPRAWLVFGGEPLPFDLCRRVAAQDGACQILNHYGPTETTVGSLTWAVERAPQGEGSVPIGRPIACTEAHVLDHTGQQAPLGVAGELYLGGAGLARGYWGRPDQTAERFVPHPFAKGPGERLYRTGDRVRCRPDGSVEFLGRSDHQVKIRGHRVEPGEVEATLLRHPDVAQVVVVARRDAAEEARLVAYVVAEGATLDTTALRSFLAEHLPEPMIPALFVTLPVLPRGASGKLDRAALPVPEALATGQVAPRNATERTLAEIWATVLRLPRVGIHDDFFELGGDSIVSIQVAARAAGAGLELTPLQVFRFPTVALCAAAIQPAGTLASEEPTAGGPLADAATAARATDLAEPKLEALLATIGVAAGPGAHTPVARERVESTHTLTPLQQGLLFHCVYDAAARPYVTQLGYTLPADTDIAAFSGAWQGLIDRHAILRTAFAWEGFDEPLQAVLRDVRLPLACHDLRALTPDAREQRLAALAEADLDATSRLATAPLLRLTLAQLEGGAHRCLFTYHHLLLDGWSQVILDSELSVLYDALRFGRSSDLAPAPPYGAYVEWLRGQDLAAAEAFWRTRLAGFDTPTPLPELAAERAAPSAPVLRQRSLSRPATAALQACARRQRLTLNTLVQGAWALTLSQASAREDVVFGATFSGRPAALPGAEAIVGAFINTLPVRVRITPATPVGEWLALLQEAQLELRAYEFSPLVHVQRWSDVPVGRRLFDSLLVFQNAPAMEAGDSVQVQDVVVRDSATHFPLSLDVRPGEQLLILASHDPERLDGAVVERLLVNLETALHAFCSAPTASVASVLAQLHALERASQARREQELVTSSRQGLRRAARQTVQVALEGER